MARRWQAAGDLRNDADPEQVGAVLMSITQGFVLQRLLVIGTEPQGYLVGVNALLAGPRVLAPSSPA